MGRESRDARSRSRRSCAAWPGLAWTQCACPWRFLPPSALPVSGSSVGARKAPSQPGTSELPRQSCPRPYPRLRRAKRTGTLRLSSASVSTQGAADLSSRQGSAARSSSQCARPRGSAARAQSSKEGGRAISRVVAFAKAVGASHPGGGAAALVHLCRWPYSGRANHGLPNSAGRLKQRPRAGNRGEAQPAGSIPACSGASTTSHCSVKSNKGAPNSSWIQEAPSSELGGLPTSKRGYYSVGVHMIAYPQTPPHTGKWAETRAIHQAALARLTGEGAGTKFLRQFAYPDRRSRCEAKRAGRSRPVGAQAA